MSCTWETCANTNSNWTIPNTNFNWTIPNTNTTISTSDTICPSCSINLNGTRLETNDIEFIHSLQAAGNGDCAAVLAQMIQEFKDRNIWTENQFKKDQIASKKEKVKKLEKEIQEKKNKENRMDIMKNFHFGPCGDRAKISPIGIAIKNSNGEWVSYDKEKSEIVNVDLLNFGNSNFVYMIPVAIKDVAEGDAVIHNKHIMFVKKVKEDGLTVVDVTDGEYKKILPTKSMFGFDFITKVVSLIDFAGIEASADNPFGNLLPFLLMNGEGDNSDALPLALMMMNSSKNGGIFPSEMSPWVMMMALKNNSTVQEGLSMSTMLPLMMFMNQKKEN